MIPTNRPVRGEDLDSLREQLGLSAADGCFLYGMSMNKWSVTTKKGARDNVESLALALLARSLSTSPELNFVPKMPRAEEIYRLVQEYQPVDLKRLAVMFGCESSSGYRWIKQGTKISPIIGRLFMVFSTLMQRAMDEGRTPEQKRERAVQTLYDWNVMVADEAQRRGIHDIFVAGRWQSPENAQLLSPVCGQHLAELREELRLTTMESIWLLGMSPTKWGKLINDRDTSSQPLKNASLALLVRALRDHPDANPVPQMASPKEVYELLQSIERPAANAPEDILAPRSSTDGLLTVDLKRLARMFGCEDSSGYRWITLGSNISPVLARLFRIFLGRHNALFEQHPGHATGDELDVQLLNDWDLMVVAEGRARGIPNIFSPGPKAKLDNPANQPNSTGDVEPSDADAEFDAEEEELEARDGSLT